MINEGVFYEVNKDTIINEYILKRKHYKFPLSIKSDGNEVDLFLSPEGSHFERTNIMFMKHNEDRTEYTPVKFDSVNMYIKLESNILYTVGTDNELLIGIHYVEFDNGYGTNFINFRDLISIRTGESPSFSYNHNAYIDINNNSIRSIRKTNNAEKKLWEAMSEELKKSNS